MTIHATPGQPPLRAGDQTQTAAELQEIWDNDPRWDGIERTYTAEDVIRIRGSVREESTLAHRGAENLWNLLNTEDCVRALGAYTDGQAVQQVRAGLKAIHLSGWQVAADGNLAGQTYTATKHQREAGTGYFDVISTALNPESATLALAGSTEAAQFH